MRVGAPDEQGAARWCRLLTEPGTPADPARLELPAPPLPDALAATRGATVIHPGAASAARRWPAERFARAARAAPSAGRRGVVAGGPRAGRGGAPGAARLPGGGGGGGGPAPPGPG